MTTHWLHAIRQDFSVQHPSAVEGVEGASSVTVVFIVTYYHFHLFLLVFKYCLEIFVLNAWHVFLEWTLCIVMFIASNDCLDHWSLCQIHGHANLSRQWVGVPMSSNHYGEPQIFEHWQDNLVHWLIGCLSISRRGDRLQEYEPTLRLKLWPSILEIGDMHF